MFNMQPVHLPAIDLNLLVVLDALLAERNVTRAARRVGLSQSAASHALGRLRELFGDPLLERTARGMRPTPRGAALAPGLPEALTRLSHAVAQAPPFDPATARQSFRVASADYVEFVLLPPLFKRIDRLAHGVDLWVQSRPGEVLGSLHRGEVDLALGVIRSGDVVEGLEHEVLLRERFVCVVRKGSALSRGRLTLKRYLAARHVVIAPGGTRGSLVDDILAAENHARTVALTIPHFLVAPHVVARTDLVLTLGERLAKEFARHLPLTLLEPPFAIPGFAISMIWSARRSNDLGLRWLRDELVLAARGGRASR